MGIKLKKLGVFFFWLILNAALFWIPFACLRWTSFFSIEGLRRDCSNTLGDFASIAAILAFSLALCVVIWKFPKKYLIPRLEPCFDNLGDFTCYLPQSENNIVKIEERSCYLYVGFRNLMSWWTVKPKVCIEVPKHLWHMDYLTDEEMDRHIDGFSFKPSEIVPGCCAVIGKGGRELSHWCEGTGPDGRIWVKLGDEKRENKRYLARTCRSFITEEDRNSYKVREKCTRMLIFADINFVPKGDYRKFWVRVKLPGCGDCTRDNTVKLHLSFSFFQAERSITHPYGVSPIPLIDKNDCRGQDVKD